MWRCCYISPPGDSFLILQFDAIRWSDYLPPALGGLRLQESHAGNIALWTSAAVYTQPEVTGGGGHTRRFRRETMIAPPPQPDGAALRRIGRGSFTLPLTGEGGTLRQPAGCGSSTSTRPTHWTESRAAQAVLFSLSWKPGESSLEAPESVF